MYVPETPQSLLTADMYLLSRIVAVSESSASTSTSDDDNDNLTSA
jgi:hypothetical protein